MPVHGVKIAIKGYDIKRIHIEPGANKAKSRKMDEGVEVTLPQVDLHSMIVAELR